MGAKNSSVFSQNILAAITNMAIAVAFLVIMLGAYTRLTDSGLGCPDWPGCYGHVLVSSTQLPASVEKPKAWIEMIHRYAAGMLALFICTLAGVVWIQREHYAMPRYLPFMLVSLLFVQAMFGMWTVTLKLLPVVVMGHLLGGLAIFSYLTRLRWYLSKIQPLHVSIGHGWIIGAVCLLILQISLGGWVSANYAGLACVGFPKCNGQWLPITAQGFNIFNPIGDNYQGGLLDNAVRAAIHSLHRLGAGITTIYLLLLSGFVITWGETKLRVLAMLVILLVLIQFSLGVANVIYLLPLWIAIAHNGVAVLLLATVLGMHYLTQRQG